MKFIAMVRSCFPVVICTAIFSMSLLMASAEDPAREGALRGSGLLIIDPRDSQDQIKTRLRRIFSFAGQDINTSKSRQTEIEREIAALFGDDTSVAEELPEVSFVFHRGASADAFRTSLLNSELVHQSDEVCPEDCVFRDSIEDSMHIHLTKPVGGPGDTVLVLRIPEPRDWTEEAFLAGAMSLRREWSKRIDENYVTPKGMRVFGLRVTLMNSEN